MVVVAHGDDSNGGRVMGYIQRTLLSINIYFNPKLFLWVKKVRP